MNSLAEGRGSSPRCPTMEKETIKNKLREAIDVHKDIIVTIPKKIKWVDYEKELEAVKDGVEVMNFKVNHFPKTKEGCKCFILHDGKIKGWMEIVGLSEEKFTCTTTGKKWSGKFVQRSGPFNKIDEIPMKGFQGFRYMKED